MKQGLNVFPRVLSVGLGRSPERPSIPQLACQTLFRHTPIVMFTFDNGALGGSNLQQLAPLEK